MKVILLNDVENLGLAGDIVVVKPGYARNRLIPKGLALRASNKNIAVASERKKVANVKLERENIALQSLAKIDGKTVWMFLNVLPFFCSNKIPTKFIQISAFLKSSLIFCSSNMLASTILIKPLLPAVLSIIPFW